MAEESNHFQKEYLKRISRILDFIEKNLDTDLSLEFLSKKVHYSPYHFHRLFSTIIGEPLNQYVNRKRIERIAAILISQPKKSIKKLAYDYGFNSESSFARSFKKYYGVSPTTFKSDGKKILSKNGIIPFSMEEYICSIDNQNNWITMNAQIVITQLQEIKLAGITQLGEFEKMEKMFQRLMEWGFSKQVLPQMGFKAITIYHDNPHVTQLEKVRFSACVTINKDVEAEGDIRPLSIEKGLFAVGRFEIKPDDFAMAWKNMTLWVIENGYEFRDGDFFEIYHNVHKSHPEQKFILDICIPLEKTKNIKLDEKININLSGEKNSNNHLTSSLDYHQLINFMKELRTYFQKEYESYFKLGRLYQNSPDYSYFSLTTSSMKKLKLKFVIILDHQAMNFSICLSGQNKSIRKKYWQMFKNSDWNKYHLVENIDNSLMILNQIIIPQPNFNEKEFLTQQIEKKSFDFINDLQEILG